MTEYTHESIHLSAEIQRWCEKRRDANNRIEGLVVEARKAGMTWLAIGCALGVSTQSAWERYGLTPQQKAARAIAQDRRFSQLSLIPDVELPDDKPAKKKKARKPRAQHET